MNNANKGQLFIFSGPSGIGKDTVLQELLRENEDIKLSISSITRPMRSNEREGEKYNFISKDKFETMLANDELLEYNEYCGNYYGTPKGPVEQWMSQGHNVVLEIEVNGARKVKQKLPEAVMVFMLPPTFDTLYQRLKSRGTEDEQTIQKRLKQAVYEISCAKDYDFVFVNDKIEDAVADLYAIIRANTLTRDNMSEFIKGVEQDAESFNR